MSILRHFALASCVIIAFAPGDARADLIAYWNFNDLTNSTNNGPKYVPSAGKGTIGLVVPDVDNEGASQGINSFSGTTINALNSDEAGQGLAIQGGSGLLVSPGNNGSSLQFYLNLKGLADPIISLAWQRSPTGFSEVKVFYSLNFVDFIDTSLTYDPPAAFALNTIDLSDFDALDGAANATIALFFNGATTNTGNIRFDNIQVDAIAAVPEPTSFALATIMVAFGAVATRAKRNALRSGANKAASIDVATNSAILCNVIAP